MKLCVTDAGERSLRVYSGEGIFTFATGGVAELAQPGDALLDAMGGFVLLDSHSGLGRTLRRLDYRGEPQAFSVERPRADWSPQHLLLTRDGGLVTVDNAHRLLCKHDGASGALLWSRESCRRPRGRRPRSGPGSSR